MLGVAANALESFSVHEFAAPFVSGNNVPPAHLGGRVTEPGPRDTQVVARQGLKCVKLCVSGSGSVKCPPK